ncbi:MAG: low specificity L-threonine aldolase [Candidatus Sericytochromatia bacterium]
MRYLASDNNAGIDPVIFQALAAANSEHAVGYGADAWTERMQQAFCTVFGPQARAYPVLTGTGANVLSLSALLAPYEAVLCSRMSHLYVDECGAPERFLGTKLIPVAARDGKLAVADLEKELQPPNDEHRVQPRVVSITQATEAGTLYSLEEIRAIADFAHAHEMYLHMDGARIANAAVALDTDFKELCRGVDVLSFGATKNGLLCGEAVVFLRPDLDRHFKFLRKQGMQLLSKQRFVAAQLEAYLQPEVWAANARQANAMARLLAESVASLEAVEIVFPVQTNAVFARLPLDLIAPLQERCFFYVLDEDAGIVRWMTAFDTRPEDITGFVEALKELWAERSRK